VFTEADIYEADVLHRNWTNSWAFIGNLEMRKNPNGGVKVSP